MPALASPQPDERAQLLAYVDQQRDGIRNAAYGLTDEQAALAPTASDLCIGGLVKHAAAAEASWMNRLRVEPLDRDYRVGWMERFRMEPGESLADALAELDAVGAETTQVMAEVDLDRIIPVPDAPWFPKDVDGWPARWVVLHVIEELARHAGHADIIRESIDGAAMLPLMAAVEGWPATDWLTPWQPAGG